MKPRFLRTHALRPATRATFCLPRTLVEPSRPRPPSPYAPNGSAVALAVRVARYLHQHGPTPGRTLWEVMGVTQRRLSLATRIRRDWFAREGSKRDGVWMLTAAGRAALEGA